MAKVKSRPSTPTGRPTNGHTNPHKPAKRPRTVWMDVSDEESTPVKANKKNALGSPKKKMKHADSNTTSGKSPSIQEQRKQLPIAQGTLG